jgi:hypothetical protein
MESENEQEHFFYIDSNVSRNYYPTNSSADFINHLPSKHTFEVSKYEAGLVWVQLHDKYEKPSEVPVKKFFGKTLGDNIMTVRYESPIVRQIEKGDRGIDSLITVLSGMWKGDIERITFMERIEATNSYAAIKFPNPRKGRLVLSAELQRVLGFSNQVITGNVRGEDPMDNEYYDSLSKETAFQVSFILDNKNDLEMPEPSEYSFQSLVNAYAAKFNLEFPSYSVIYKFEKQNGQDVMYMDVENTNVFIKFPDQINLLLGIEPSHEVHGDNTFILPSEMINPAISQAQQLIFSSNLAKLSFVYGQLLPVLRVVKREDIKEFQLHQFDSVLYVPLDRVHVQDISLTIRDSNLKLIPTSQYNTTALIHVRPIR